MGRLNHDQGQLFYSFCLEDAVKEPFSGSTTRAGWTVGGGVQAALIGDWTWKVEYLYMDFGTANLVTALGPPVFPGSEIHQALHFTDSIVSGGVNLRFLLLLRSRLSINRRFQGRAR